MSKRALRREADRRSNINKAPKKPVWATKTGTENMAPGTSIFDPVLCEIVYRWFCPPGGTVLDPFAGGSVRGIVASVLGYRYMGIDLSRRQIEANRVQAKEICKNGPLPQWHIGDSRNIIRIAGNGLTYNFLFSCPPYGDLEIYSDDPRDISNLDYENFKIAYYQIIKNSLALLKSNRFACFVVGDFRGPDGFYRRFVQDTVTGFERGGGRLYNEAILVTMMGSLPIRVSAAFDSGRKLGRAHQNVLIFFKGDPRTIKNIFVK